MDKDTFLKIRISELEYNNFQHVCEEKGKTMSEVIRSFINNYVDKYPDTIIMLSADKNTIENASKLCKNQKIKFNDLIKQLINNEFLE